MEIFKSRDTHQRGRGGPPLSSAIFLLGGIYFPGVCFFNTLLIIEVYTFFLREGIYLYGSFREAFYVQSVTVYFLIRHVFHNDCHASPHDSRCPFFSHSFKQQPFQTGHS